MRPVLSLLIRLPSSRKHHEGRVSQRNLLRYGYLVASAGYSGSAYAPLSANDWMCTHVLILSWLIYQGYPVGSDAAAGTSLRPLVYSNELNSRAPTAVAAAQALSSVYMLRTTANSPHAWTFYYSSFASFYYLADSVRLRTRTRV